MTFFHLLWKDSLLLVRDRSAIVLSIFMAVLIAVIASAGVAQSFLPPHQVVKIFPTLLWLGFLSASALALPQLHAVEERERVGEGVLLSGVSPQAMFASKLIIGVVLAELAFMVVAVVLAVMLHVEILRALGPLSLIGLLTSLSYVALGNLLSVIAIRSRMGSVLLPLLVMPLAIPLFLVSVEGTITLLVEGAFSLDAAWFGLLLLMTFVYTGVGFILYPRVCRE